MRRLPESLLVNYFRERCSFRLKARANFPAHKLPPAKLFLVSYASDMKFGTGWDRHWILFALNPERVSDEAEATAASHAGCYLSTGRACKSTTSPAATKQRSEFE